MENNRTDKDRQQKPSRKKSFDPFYIIAILSILVVILVFFLWRENDYKIFSEDEKVTDRTVPEEISVPEQTQPPKTSTDQPTPVDNDRAPNHLKFAQSSQTDTEKSTIAPDNYQQAPQVTSKTSEASTSPISDNSSMIESVTKPDPTEDEIDIFTKKCVQSADTVRLFYNHLDRQEYMKKYGLKAGSEKHFTHLIQRLLDNPPVVSGETDDLFTILQNTAHFFRIIGKDNILILKGILDREKDQFENVLSNFHTVFFIPSCPANSFNLHIADTTPLYEYAGFFLNTMGGRLYLFRRDSISRMVVNYYAILLVDQANKEGKNRHGIDINAAIDQLIIEMEANTNQLKLEQQYLDSLYTLKERYQ